MVCSTFKQKKRQKEKLFMGSSPLKEDSKEITQETHASKRRKVMQKTVVRVKMGANVGSRLKNEGPPFDSWSWRKYGQKPIKGSPHPRGYYRCSTSKGCSAKKQVERCKTDSSVLIITYTSSHNHPDPPDVHTTTSPKQEQDHEDQFHYLESSKDCSENNVVVDNESCFLDSNGESLGVLVDEEPVPCPLQMDFTGPKSEESYDFFDELEELPIYSSFTSFKVMGSLFECDERIPIVPS